MFSAAIQPSVVSLFSSTSSAPLQIFTQSVDRFLPTDSCIHLLHDESSQPTPVTPAALLSPPSQSQTDDPDYALNQTVLQIQSPTLRTTYIQCPPVGLHNGDKLPHLGIKHPWMHIQVRNMGREWAFEVGLVDHAGRMGVLRLSTFQKHPRLRLPALNPAPGSAYPLLHLPLAFPSSSSRPLTAWATVTLCLPSYLPYFSSPKLTAGARGTRNDVPCGTYSHMAYVRVYATCRLRRIWFTEGGPGQKAPWEFELYGGE